MKQTVGKAFERDFFTRKDSNGIIRLYKTGPFGPGTMVGSIVIGKFAVATVLGPCDEFIGSVTSTSDPMSSAALSNLLYDQFGTR